MKKMFLGMLLILLVSCQNSNLSNNSVNYEDTILELESEQTVEDHVFLTVLGRASVKLEFSDGAVVYIDPYAGSPEAYDSPADLVLVTHQHSDHNAVERVHLKTDGEVIECPMDIRSGQIYQKDDIEIRAVNAYNDNHFESESCGFIITYKDIVIYHSGDTSTTAEMTDLAQYEIDYALLCCDGYYNMDVEEAADVAQLLDAGAIIPIHTSPNGNYDAKIASSLPSPRKLVVEPEEKIELHNLSSLEEQFGDSIEVIIDNRLSALNAHDYDLYMKDITTVNPYYYNEQERWFMGMIDDTITDIELEIVSKEIIDLKTASVTLNQRHLMDQEYDFQYTLLFRLDDGGWKDYGYHFEVLETDQFTIKYMEGETRVEEFKVMLEDAFRNLDSLYTEKPHSFFEMKLFTDQELLRQRTIPSNGWLFSGWSEPDESLKMYTGHHPNYLGYPGVVQHELVHHITIRICNNNLPTWLLEGIAMYDGSAFYPLKHSGLLSQISRSGVKNEIEYLESLDFNGHIAGEDIRNFYNTSFMYVKFISEKYGHDTLMDLFYLAGEKPFHDSTLNEEFDKNNQITAEEVIKEVLGMTKEELSNAYLMWLEDVDFNTLNNR